LGPVQRPSQLKTENAELLSKFISEHHPNVLCFQEHKLQEKDVAPIEKQLIELLPGYTAHWTCSTEKKGYSGLVVLTRGTCGVQRGHSCDARRFLSPGLQPVSHIHVRRERLGFVHRSRAISCSQTLRCDSRLLHRCAPARCECTLHVTLA
jgi:exonuclease III